jgi:hypothetical protein
MKVLDASAPCAHPDRDQQPMLRAVCHFVDCPDEIVPSLVRLETPKEREDVRRQIVASTPTNNAHFQAGGVVSNGKVSVLGIGLAGSEGRCESGLVERGSQFLSHGDRVVNEVVGDGMSQFDFMRLVDSIRMWLNNMGIWFRPEEEVNSIFEVSEVFLCSRDSAFGAGKWV